MNVIGLTSQVYFGNIIFKTFLQRVCLRANGDQVAVFADGTCKILFSDGHKSVMFSNGDVKDVSTYL